MAVFSQNHKITKLNSMKILYFFLIININAIFATNYYVNPVQGNDGNNGRSPNAAFRTLSRVQGINLQPGDNVYLMNGVYENPGNTLLVIDESGSSDNWITIQNYPGHSPLLKFDSWVGIDLVNGASYVAFKGIRIQGARSKITLEQALAQPGSCQNDQVGDAEGFYNGTGILIVGPNLRWSNPATTGNEVPHHILVENCEIFDCTSSGVAAQQADYITVRNSKIYNNAWYTLYGTSGINFYQFVNTDGTTGIHNEVNNNLIYGNQLKVPQLPSCKFFDGNAFIVDDFNHNQTGNYKDPTNGFDPYSAQTVIKNNVVIENGGSGLHFFLSSNCKVYNNTVVNNAFQNNGSNGNGDIRIGRCSNFDIRNNIFKGETRVNAVSGNTNITYTNNYHEGPDIVTSFLDCQSCITEGIVFDNIDISSASPLGIIIPEVTTDYLQNNRNITDGIDIGAYELGSCASITWYADNDNDGFGSITDMLEACEQPFGYVRESGDECDDNPNTTTQMIWYADNDNDGVGNTTETITACDQPAGYIAISGDSCDDDANKVEPGECGCDVEEGTCEVASGNCAAPEFSINTAYDQARTKVLYKGRVYENKWYAQGKLPTAGEPWVLIDICDGSGEDCSIIPDWNTTTAYPNVGTKVSYEGKVYSNRWYAAGKTPGIDQVWLFVNICSSSKTASNAKKNTSIKVYPTAFKNRVTIHAKSPSNIEIYNITGQLLKSVQINKGNNVLEMHNVSSGQYFLHIKNSKFSSVQRIIKL